MTVNTLLSNEFNKEYSKANRETQMCGLGLESRLYPIRKYSLDLCVGLTFFNVELYVWPKA